MPLNRTTSTIRRESTRRRRRGGWDLAWPIAAAVLASIAPCLGGATTVWSPQDNPHVVSGTYLVPSGHTLIIEAGTRVVFDPDARLLVNGTVLASGTPASPIEFEATGSTLTAGSVTVDAGGAFEVRHAEIGVDVIPVRNAAIVARSCSFGATPANIWQLGELDPANVVALSDCTFSTGSLRLAGATVALRNVTFLDPWAGVVRQRFYEDKTSSESACCRRRRESSSVPSRGRGLASSLSFFTGESGAVGGKWAAMFLSGLIVLGLAATPVDARLDSLILEERFSEAFGKAVDELSLRLAARGYRDPWTIAELHRVGVIAHLAGDQATAGDVFEAALAARRSILPANDPSIIETLIYRGRASRYENERQRARRDYDEAARRLALLPQAPAELSAQLLQSEADWQRSVDIPKAIEAYRAALALRRSSGAKPDFATVDNLTWLAWTLSRAGQRDEGRALAIEARAQLVRLGLTAHSLRATLDNLLAENLAIDGRLTDAVPLFRTTAATAEAARHKQLGGYSRRGFPLDGYEPLALEALSRGRSEEAWTLLERARAPSHVDFATLAAWSGREPASWQAWRRLHDALKEAKRRWLEGTARGAPWTSSTAPLFVSALKLRASAYDLERRFLDAYRPRTPSLSAVRALLGPHDALVGWLDVNFGGDPSPNTLPQRSRGWAYVLRKDGPIAWVSLWDTRTPEEFRDLAKDTGSVFESLRRAASWRRRVDPDPEISVQMRAWSKLMVDPLLPYLKGVDHVISERLLDPLELAVLPDGRMLGEEFDLSYVPSALTWGLLAEEGAHPSGTPSILAVSGRSDPPVVRVASLVDMDETSRSQRQLRNAYRRDEFPLDRLPRLRYAALEAETVSSTFRRHLVLSDTSTAAGVLDDMADRGKLGEFSVIHIAAHTLTDNAPEHCALAIGRPVEVEDILLGWRLDADLMTLSGCETLRAAGAGRGEPYGFTPALFASGARRVLSSIWTVDDRATTILMDRFYEDLTGSFAGSRLGYLHAPMPAAHALREAKTYVRTLADAKGRHPFEHPAYWAGFLLVGLP